jgi:hypothetical protein
MQKKLKDSFVDIVTESELYNRTPSPLALWKFLCHYGSKTAELEAILSP